MHQQSSRPGTDSSQARFATALRGALRRGYGLGDLRADLLAGLVVGAVALPLSMALAIASGVPPAHGLYTAIIAGVLVAPTGGSPVQVTGPTAAFVVILAPIAARYGLAGLGTATVLAGLLLIAMGAARLGRLIEFVPYPVTAGFTAGIAVVIGTLQLRDLLGLQIAVLPEHYLERLHVMLGALPTLRLPDALIGALTLSLLFLAPRFARRVPAALVALPVATLVGAALSWTWPDAAVQTIGTRFGGLPGGPPRFAWPWQFSDATHGPLPISLDMLRELILPAFTIATLGAIESLLSAVVAAGLSGKDHDPNAELIGQGLGNLVAPFFGGFAATGAIARTAANVRAGARSPLAAVAHGAFLFLCLMGLAPVLACLPMASMGALLLLVAWNMGELRHVVHVLRVAPRSDSLVLVLCFALTIVFDMTVAVTVGVVLAALVFMRRMAALTDVRLVGATHPLLREPLPPHVLLYEVAGPLFFGAAQRAMSALRRVDRGVTVVVLDMRAVPIMDATGLVNLESALARLQAAEVYTIIAGIQRQPLELIARAGWKRRQWLAVYGSFEHGLHLARDLSHLLLSPQPRPVA